MPKKRLVLRLSSLGDVILASSVLEVESVDSTSSLDWVVSKEYTELLRGHPKIGQIFEFDRKSKLQGWFQLARKLWQQNYTEVYDLHRSLRTRLLFFLFLFWSFKEKVPLPQWKTVSKQKLKLFFYFVCKGFWPKHLRPQPFVQRFSQVLGGSGKERPNLKHLLQGQSLPNSVLELQTQGKKYIAVMPSSRWKGKKWPVQYYTEVLKKVSFVPVILGTRSDQESLALAEQLRKESIPFVSGIGAWGFRETAIVLSYSAGYLGGDTGLAHLAEAIGASATVIFGPTHPEMGFGPWRQESRSVGSSLWCRPCSKDGRACFRIAQPYACLKSLSPQTVVETFSRD